MLSSLLPHLQLSLSLSLSWQSIQDPLHHSQGDQVPRALQLLFSRGVWLIVLRRPMICWAKKWQNCKTRYYAFIPYSHSNMRDCILLIHWHKYLKLKASPWEDFTYFYVSWLQIRNLKQKYEVQDVEIQKLKKHVQKATSLAAQESSKCSVAKEVIKSVAAQVLLLIPVSPVSWYFFLGVLCADDGNPNNPYSHYTRWTIVADELAHS